MEAGVGALVKVSSFRGFGALEVWAHVVDRFAEHTLHGGLSRLSA